MTAPRRGAYNKEYYKSRMHLLTPYTGEAILRNFTKFRKRLLTPEEEAKMRGLTYDKKGVALFWRV